MLLALGFVVIYRATRILNLAHGEFMMVGGYLVCVFIITLGMNLVLGILLALISAAVIAGILYYAIFRSLIGEPLYVPVIATIGVSIMLQGIAGAAFGPHILSLAPAFPLSMESVHLPGGVVLSTVDLAIVGISILTLLALAGLYQFTNFGYQLRATSENPTLASKRRINIDLSFVISWGIAMLIATLTGILWGTSRHLYPEVGMVGLKAFPAAMVGGMDSLKGTIPGSLIVATSVVLCMTFIGPEASDVLPMIILLIVLNVRPWGLFGRIEEIERV